ncbi:MAG: hypothetical protein Q9M97_08180 [Candidatus Gracilibacteria bacterium]|nr:hypothetical protein [Candidatus Gracilibacteria bacterium]
MYFVVNILSGSIVEFILEFIIDKELIKKDRIPLKVKEKFKMMEGLKELSKIYNLIDSDRIVSKISSIQLNRNMIHPNGLEKGIGNIESKAKQTLIDLEEIILYFGL